MGYVGAGVSGSCKGGVGHAGLGGSCRGGVGHVEVRWVMEGWGASYRGGLGCEIFH